MTAAAEAATSATVVHGSVFDVVTGGGWAARLTGALDGGDVVTGEGWAERLAGPLDAGDAAAARRLAGGGAAATW